MALSGLPAADTARIAPSSWDCWEKSRTRSIRRSIESLVRGVRESRQIALMGAAAIPFEEARDLLFRGDIVLPGHPNGMRFTAFDPPGAILRQEVYYSVGGGFIEREGQPPGPRRAMRLKLPYPFSSAAEMLAQGDAAGLPDLGHDAGEREGAARRGGDPRAHRAHLDRDAGVHAARP